MNKIILKHISKRSVFVSIIFLSGIFLLSQSRPHNPRDKSERQIRLPVDTSIPLDWTNGYTLVLLQDIDILSVKEAKDFITAEGGTVAIFSSAHAMLGWASPSIATKIMGKHGIEAVFFEPVDLETLKYQDQITISLAKFFNSVVSGDVARQYESFRIQGDPLIGDFREHPFVDPNAVITNLEDKHVAWDTEIVKIRENQGLFPGYSDALTGTIAVCLMFIESDGSIDSNLYSWTTSAVDLVIGQCISGASWWSSKASSYGKSASFYIRYYDPTTSFMKQGYEPILHSSRDDSYWINAVMSNLGFSNGTKNDRVTAFNAWLRSWASTNWAYTCLFAYNPSGSSSTFIDGRFAYAFLGGPYSQMLYRNDNWSTSDIWSIFAHETGHIFWACDEYYQAGYGGCTNCAPCSNYRPITNGNCEHPNCNPYGSVPCIMKYNSNDICSYTVTQVGWQTQTLTIQAGQGGTTNPTPGIYAYTSGSQVQVNAVPDAYYEFVNWTGSISGTQNPVTVTMDADKTIKANFRFIYAPIATGYRVLNRTFSQAEYIDILSWQANPANEGLAIANYRIYVLSGSTPSLLAELAGNQFTYMHRNAGRASVQYAIVAVTSRGREGAPALITVQ